MKKLYFVLLVMTALFFASCGTSGTQEYKDWKKACSKLEKAIDKAKSCEELEDAYEAFDDATELLTDKDYAKGQEMTDEEEDELDLSIKQLEKKYDRMEEKLCDDD
jgi:hypothetical protein